MWTRTRFYVVLPLLLAANWFVFRACGVSYFRWYLANGSAISVAALLGVLSWSKLAGYHDLISRNAAEYARACLYAVGSIALDLGQEIQGAGTRLPDDSAWDKFWTLLVSFLLGCVLLTWFLVVSPLNYVVTLVAGAPARLFRQRRALETSSPAVNADESPVRLGDDPLALTQAISALLLFLARLAYEHFAKR